MSIAETTVLAEEIEESIQRENDRRYAFYRMLHATDRVLNRLEELNLREIRELPDGVGERIRQWLAELPESVRAKLCGGSVQQVMDGIYEAQEALFVWHDPSRLLDLAGEGEDGD